MSRRRLTDRLFTWAVAGCAAVAVGALVAVLGAVLARGLGAVSWTFLTEPVRAAGAEGGIVWQLFGTALLVATAAAVAVPVAAGTALTLHVFTASSRVRRTLEAALHGLNSVPSIVFGLFGLLVFFQILGLRKSWLAGGLLLGMMIVPTIAVAFLERLRAIPRATVEAATGLGLPRSAVVTSIFLPQAASGLVTGTLLGLARAAGETAPLLFTAAVFSGATAPRGVVDSPVVALPYHVFVLAQDSFDPRVAANVWGAAIVLVVFVLALSAAALPVRLRIHEEASRV